MKNEENQNEKSASDVKINYQAVKGNLVDVPEFKQLENGKSIAEFTIKQSYPVTKGEEKTYVNNYHNCVAFGEQAEKMKNPKFIKGAFVEVEGKSNIQVQEKETGNNYFNKVLVNNAQVLEHGVKPFQQDNNHLELTGNLTKDPEIKVLDGGKKVANITLAHNYKIGDQEKVMYANAAIFNEKIIEHLEKNDVKKGETLGIKGSIEPSSYEDKNGEKRYTVKISANFVALNKSKEQVVDKEKKQEVEASVPKAEKKAEKKKETASEKKSAAPKKDAEPKKKSGMKM